jgi:hypothetical protein
MAARFLGIIFFAAASGFSSTALGQGRSDPPFVSSCTNADQRIELIVVATRTPAGATTAESLNWVIKEMPGPDQVIVCDTLKQKIIRALAKTTPGPGDFRVASGQPFIEYLQTEVDGIDEILPPGGPATPQPADVGKEFNVVFCVTPEADACAATSAVETSAEIEIATATGRSGTVPDIPTFTLGASVPVKLFYSIKDLEAARKDPAVVTEEQARASVQAELRKVAEAVYAEMVKTGALGADGKPLFDGPRDERAQQAFIDFVRDMKGIYELRGGVFDIAWTGEVKPQLQCRGQCVAPMAWVWSVDGLRLVENTNIEVIQEEWETQEVQGDAIAARLRNRRQKAYDMLNGAASPKLAVKPGHIVTRPDSQSDIDRLKTLVEAVEKVKSGPLLTPGSPSTAPDTQPGYNVIYAVRRKKKPELNLALKAGGSYSKELSATGLLGIEEVNLLRLKETITLSAEGGGEVQRYRFSFTRPFERSDEPRLEIRDFSISAQVFKDKDRRLGNLTEDEIAAREVGSSANFSFGYDSVGARDRLNENCITDVERPRMRYGFLANLSLNYRDVNIRDDDKLLAITGVSRELLPRERTQTTTVALGVNALLRYDFRNPNAKGPGVLELRFAENVEKGFDLFGADYRYWKSRTVAGGDLTFGFSSFRDMFIRYRHGYERSSQNTPIFALPLLGGSESVRGLEEGEFIGRSVSFDQFEVGLNVASVWNMLRGKGRLKDSLFCPYGSESSEPPAPFDYTNLYLKGFFDYGRLGDSPVAPAAGGLLRRADGYGIALELRDLMADESGRRVNLSIGYGRSPQSRLHRSGMIVTSVTLDF